MAASDENRDDFERIIGKSQPDPKSKEAGEFTRTFFGFQAGAAPDLGKDSEPGAGLNQDSAALTNANTPPTPPVGQFTRFFGNLNDDAPAAFSEAAGDAIHPAIPPVLPKPLPAKAGPAQYYSFAAEDITEPGAHRSHPGLTEAPEPAVPPSPDPFAPRLPKVETSGNQLGDVMGLHPPVLPSPVLPMIGPDRPQKATGLVSSPGQTHDQPALSAGPSDFTRVINSSALRSAEGGPGSDAPPANTPVQQPIQDAALRPAAPWPPIQMPVAAPRLDPASYVPPQAMPAQVSIPAMMARVEPQRFPVQASPPAQPATPLEGQTFEQKLVAYWPLIAALVFLLFVALLLILLFALSR